MKRSIRRGFLLLGLVSGMMLVGNAAAQLGTTVGDEAGKYTGLSGSQALQERMYEERMRQLTGGPAQADQQPQGIQGQTGMKGAEESSQKLQPEKETGRTKGQK
jgi:hypothetical protein